MKRKINFSGNEAFFLLLFFVFSLYLGRETIVNFGSFPSPDPGNVFIEVSGSVSNPGVYSFADAPCLKRVMDRCERPLSCFNAGISCIGGPYFCGTKIHIDGEGTEIRISIAEMSSFYKLTLGIPLSLNSETWEGLTAIPGIGPKTARALVRERVNRGGFDKLEEVLSVRGIGEATYERVRPFLKL